MERHDAQQALAAAQRPVQSYLTSTSGNIVWAPTTSTSTYTNAGLIANG